LRQQAGAPSKGPARRPKFEMIMLKTIKQPKRDGFNWKQFAAAAGKALRKRGAASRKSHWARSSDIYAPIRARAAAANHHE
jgi:hypothetical protein